MAFCMGKAAENKHMEKKREEEKKAKAMKARLIILGIPIGIFS